MDRVLKQLETHWNDVDITALRRERRLCHVPGRNHSAHNPHHFDGDHFMYTRKKLLAALVLSNVVIAVPVATVQAAGHYTSVQTPSSRHQYMQTTTPDQRTSAVTQRAQQAQDNAHTLQGMTPSERHDAYSASAQDARSKASDAVGRATDKGAAMSSRAQDAAGAAKSETQPYRGQYQSQPPQASGFGNRGWSGRR
ncbi:MAG: hypothetical protein ACYDC8_11215 [Gammaproteobacteria bacterium]